jgi:hypothetical protein
VKGRETGALLINRPPADVATLHRALGNAGTARLARYLQMKSELTVGAPGDRYEREADAVADRVMAMPDAAVQRQDLEDEAPEVQAQVEEEEEPEVQTRVEEEEEEEPEVQTQAEEEEEEEPVQAKAEVAPVVTQRMKAELEATRGSGAPLSRDARAFMEPRFGRDFGAVRVHTGGRAAGLAKGLRAQAFTRGADVYFASGKYAPETAAGKRLLAHELAHTVQQKAGGKDASFPAVQRYTACESEDKCPAREKGEVAKSRTSEGIITPDVRKLGPRKILIADFGVYRSNVKSRTRKEAMFYLRGLRDPAISIDITGFSDCGERFNVDRTLRHRRALAVRALLPRKLRSKAFWSMMAIITCLFDNSTKEKRALNRGVVLEWKPPTAPRPKRGERPVAKTLKGKIYASLVPKGIWWFNGAKPATAPLYPNEGTIDFRALRPGDFEYTITRGANIINFVSGPVLVKRVVGSNIRSVKIRAIGKSARKGDVELRVKHTPAGARKATVYKATMQTRAPHRLRYLGVDHNPAGRRGYLSAHYLQLLDNFGRPMPYMDLNEYASGVKTARRISKLWRTVVRSVAKKLGATITWANAVFIDDYKVSVQGPLNLIMRMRPRPGDPNALLGTFNHYWYAGSTVQGKGVKVSRHVGYLYADHGEYRNFKSPP